MSYYEGKKVVVTGGAGFVGSHLVGELADRGASVKVFDNFSRGTPENLEGLRGKIDLITQDLARMSPDLLTADVVFDLAAAVFGVRHLYKKGADLLTLNLRITQNVLEAIAKDEVPRLVYVSSSCAYDFAGARVPHVEEDVQFPESCYGQSKFIGEAMCHALAEQYGTDIRMARLFNVYGPGDSGNSPHVIPDFMRKADAIARAKKDGHGGGPFEMIGDGEQTRAFCYIDDIVEGLLLLGSEYLEVPLKDRIYNFGNADEVRMIAIAAMIKVMYGIGAHPFSFIPAPDMDVRRRSADITRARTDLNWEPEVGLKEGLEKTREWLAPRIDSMPWRLS